jgi:hypothetical protein
VTDSVCALAVWAAVACGLAVMGGCSSEAPPRASSTTATRQTPAQYADTGSPSGASHPAEPQASPATGRTSARAEPSFSPESIEIVAKGTHGQERVLTVTAPANTRFAIGIPMSLSLQCATTVLTPGDPTSYRVVCPPAPAGSQLLATISYGAFDYGFAKSL